VALLGASLVCLFRSACFCQSIATWRGLKVGKKGSQRLSSEVKLVVCAPWLIVLEHGVEDHQELAHGGGERKLVLALMLALGERERLPVGLGLEGWRADVRTRI
jgi:hypothetical protein